MISSNPNCTLSTHKIHSLIASCLTPFWIFGERRPLLLCLGSQVDRVKTAHVIPTTPTPATIVVLVRLPVAASARSISASIMLVGGGGEGGVAQTELLTNGML